MPRKPKTKNYFGEDQEKAVVIYLTTESLEEKEKVFNEYLRDPLTTMVESIIRRYKLYRKGMEYYETHNDTISFLMTKVEKFDTTKGKKAYSYFGTICKNYLMGMIEKDSKEISKVVSYEDLSTDFEENTDYTYTIDDVPIDHTFVINRLVDDITDYMEEEELNDNETKMGYALIDLFKNYDMIVDSDGDGNKFNKNLVLYTLREMTHLNTKEIRLALKKYKVLYGDIMSEFEE